MNDIGAFLDFARCIKCALPNFGESQLLQFFHARKKTTPYLIYISQFYAFTNSLTTTKDQKERDNFVGNLRVFAPKRPGHFDQ